MALLYNNLGVFDFETSDKDPNVAQPLSLACIIVDPIKLKIVDSSEFYTLIKPEDESIIEAEALEKNKLSVAELNAKGLEVEVAFKNFSNYLQNHRKGKTGKSKIIPSGFNIVNFDLPILRKYNARFKISETFSDTKQWDLMDDFYKWWHNEDMTFINLDEIRKILGMSSEGAHTAIGDVKDCAKILIRMLGLYRNTKPRFKGAFSASSS